jgi:hypothetical protein
MTPNYKLLFEEAMALNSYLEFELDLAEEYALDLQIQLQACQNEDGDSDVATWGVASCEWRSLMTSCAGSTKRTALRHHMNITLN